MSCSLLSNSQAAAAVHDLYLCTCVCQAENWISQKRFPHNTLLPPPTGSFWVLHGAGHASRAQSCKRLETEPWKHACPAYTGRQTASEREGRDGGKGWGLEVVWLEPPGSHLTRQGRKRGNRESGEQESSRARTPQESSPASSRLPARERLSHPSHFHPFPPDTLLSSEKWPPTPPPLLWESPQSNLCLSYFHQPHGPRCILLPSDRAVDPQEHVT